nr:hypothetical protein [Tanacetum cinerariifolium]
AVGERRLVHVVSAVAGLWQWGCAVVTGAWPESGRDMVGKGEAPAGVAAAAAMVVPAVVVRW